MLLSSLKKKGTERALIKKVCLGTIKDLIEAVNNADCILENLDPVERTVVEDLREMQKARFFIANLYLLLPGFVGLFSLFEDLWNLNDINLRHYVLAFVKLVAEFYKYVMPFCEAGKGHEEVLRHMLNPASENPFDWNLFYLLFPPGHGLEEDERELVLTEVKCFIKEIIDELYNNEELEDDIPLD